MAKPTVTWSERARRKRLQILEIYIQRNRSKTYSVKLNRRINDEICLLLKYPEIGIKTNIPNVRGLIIDHFILFYEIRAKSIFIHHIWDSRQDPEKLVI